jgi:MFS family permease
VFDQNNQKHYQYRYFVYIIIICYLLVNHSFNKICVILDSFLDTKLDFPIGTNTKTIASSTFLSAFGRFFGIFTSGSKKRIIVSSFLINGICLLVCVSTKNLWIFVIFRTLQGFVAGVQNSIIFGLLGTLSNCRSGFANFTTISSMISLLIGVLMFFLDPINIIIGLIFINIFSAIFFAQTMTLRDKPLIFKEIEWRTIIALIKNKTFVIKCSFLGFFLGCTFVAIGQQKATIMNVFNIKFEGLSSMLSSITFLASGITSFFTSFHSTYLFNIMNFVGLWCIFLGLATKSIYIFLTGIFLPFCCFTIINPMVMEEVALISSNRFMSSAFATCIRSFVTALTIYIIPRVTSSVLETVVLLIFISGLFYTFIYYKNN